MRNLVWVSGKKVITETSRDDMVCSPKQARIAMMRTSFGGGTLLQSVEAMIYGSGNAELIVAWDFATEWRRDDPNIAQIGAALGLSEGQIDDLFSQAMAL